MLSSEEYIRESLNLHLFFARIMKEHSFFLEIGFTPKNGNFTENADEFRMAFDDFLKDVIELSNDVVGADYLASGCSATSSRRSTARAGPNCWR
jgi:hypothetical protein